MTTHLELSNDVRWWDGLGVAQAEREGAWPRMRRQLAHVQAAEAVERVELYKCKDIHLRECARVVRGWDETG